MATGWCFCRTGFAPACPVGGGCRIPYGESTPVEYLPAPQHCLCDYRAPWYIKGSVTIIVVYGEGFSSSFLETWKNQKMHQYKDTIIHLKAASALTTVKCPSIFVNFLLENVFRKIFKEKIQTNDLECSKCALFFHYRKENDRRVWSLRCPSLVVPCRSTAQSLAAMSRSCFSLRSEELIFLSSHKAATANFVYYYFAELVRIWPVSIIIIWNGTYSIVLWLCWNDPPQ